MRETRGARHDARGASALLAAALGLSASPRWLASAGSRHAVQDAGTAFTTLRPAAVVATPSQAASAGSLSQPRARQQAPLPSSSVHKAACLGVLCSFAAAGRHNRQQRNRLGLRAQAAGAIVAANVAGLDGPKMRIVVYGGTGYIGRAAVLELAARGHSVVVCTRPKSGIGSKESVEDVKSSFEGLGDISVVVADVTDEASLASLYASLDPPAQGAVCCLASRSGGRQDSFDIDFQATVNCVQASRQAGLEHFILLSAVCVQRPILAFQEAKLQAEAELRREGEAMAYSIVQPTAFFKSLLGQVKGVKGGAPFVMFGDGTEVRCKPISEQDLASFMADCFWDSAKKNKTLPIGGPGRALSFKEQGELLFSLVGREPNFICVPYAVFDFVQGILDFIAGLFPSQSDLAEYGRIGRYYAEQSMLVLDPATGQYSEELTPSYGRTDLRAFLTEALQEGSTKLEAQQLGDQGLGSRIGMGEE
eukprot:TRINITY_DN112191_c0_g1_i1.p1 TRINITY_DN112191_c0_g1~~TRINITY_DN112191_c0_g1_i1.p1  ORF type:complete len:493 (+),score=104.89 TRINITY_DN112191_c0_g1_i1:46-1479(+)